MLMESVAEWPWNGWPNDRGIRSQANLGFMYENGRGLPKNLKEAKKWYQLAAQQGNSFAIDRLKSLSGNFADGWEAYNRGDYAIALAEWQPLAEQGNADAQNWLGFMYQNGRGVAQDDKEAVKWYRKAAEQGHAYGQSNLGVMYANGSGVAKDDKEAVKWYRMAAEQGHAYAQNNFRETDVSI